MLDDRRVSVACLCDDSWCTAEISLSGAEAAAFEVSARFAVAVGHPLAPGDRVVRRTDRYALVEPAEL